MSAMCQLVKRNNLLGLYIKQIKEGVTREYSNVQVVTLWCKSSVIQHFQSLTI